MNERITHWTVPLLVALGLGLAACGQSTPAVGDLEQDAFDGVNAYRAEQGLPALEWNETIAEVCRGHSRAMADGSVPFGHDGFQDRVTALAETIDWESAAENVHHNFGHDDPARVAVTGWINSPGHEENMVGEYDLTGMGVAEADPGGHIKQRAKGG